MKQVKTIISKMKLSKEAMLLDYAAPPPNLMRIREVRNGVPRFLYNDDVSQYYDNSPISGAHSLAHSLTHHSLVQVTLKKNAVGMSDNKMICVERTEREEHATKWTVLLKIRRWGSE